MSEVNEIDETVKIAIRQRPLDNAKDSDIVVKYYSRSKNIIIVDDRPYCFDFVLGPDVTQKKLFEEIIRPLVGKVQRGFNGTTLSYGQTGTGKSYTMGLSTELNDTEHAGVVRNCMRLLLENIHQYELNASFIEIYNERAFDLLSTNVSEPIMVKGSKYTGRVRKKIQTLEDCNEILKTGISKRHVRPTVMNSQSSRSHVLLSIEVISKSQLKPTRAYLNLVDLAGSEDVRRTGHTGVAMSEGVNINQGLLCIGNMLQAMSVGKKVIPYRDSVLGAVLQDSINSNSYLVLLACVSAKRIDLSETLSTIRFAQRAKLSKRSPKLNYIMRELTNLQQSKTKTAHGNNFRCTTTLHELPSLKRRGCSPMKENEINVVPHSNTFCTSGKLHHTAAPQLNHTELGLTPKEKEKAKRKLIASSTTVQLQCYVQFLKTHPELQMGKNSPSHPRRMQEMWEKVAGMLNALRGATRTPQKWKESLGNWKKNINKVKNELARF